MILKEQSKQAPKLTKKENKSPKYQSYRMAKINELYKPLL